MQTNSPQLSGIQPDVLRQPISALLLPTRACKCLLRAGVNNIEDLLRFSADDLLGLRNFGLGSLIAVEARLARAGLCLRNAGEQPAFSKRILLPLAPTRNRRL